MEDPGNEKGNLQKFEIGDKVYIRKDCKEIFSIVQIIVEKQCALP